jgi:hypothetical protein
MDIVIELDGGIVRSVRVDGAYVSAEVHDYDIEGQDEGDLETDGDGRQYLPWGV